MLGAGALLALRTVRDGCKATPAVTLKPVDEGRPVASLIKARDVVVRKYSDYPLFRVVTNIPPLKRIVITRHRSASKDNNKEGRKHSLKHDS